MAHFSFIHAADLHLDTPFSAVSCDGREATFRAYDRVIDACLEHRVDALLIAGDVFDSTEKSLRAQIRFVQGLEKLASARIQIFVVHGNHDPLDGWYASLRMPPNVHVFRERVETCELRRDGELLARIAGVSHPKKKEVRNLARLFPERQGDAFHIGLLHCNVGGETGHEAYAPCEIDDLRRAGYDYWALGHVHEKRIFSRLPWVVYSGNTQGRSIREKGARGCYLIEVERNAVAGEPRFLETDAVRWLAAQVDATAFDSLDDLRTALIARCEELPSSIVRFTVTGRSSLYTDLDRAGTPDDLLLALREQAGLLQHPVWVESLEFSLGPEIDLAARKRNSDFLGDLLNCADLLTAGDLRRELEPLFRRHRYLDMPNDEELQQLAREAQWLCADLLTRGEAV
ncbi:MAG: DNA repair exonuclease [Bryobacteraceae bacterium]